MFKYLKKLENNIINNKLVIGIVIIIINVLSRNISINLSPFQKYLVDNSLVRQLLIFCITFMGTKDLKSSFILTSSFYILSAHLLHEDSPINIIPKRLKKSLDTNNDNVISQKEIDDAISTLSKVKLNN
jgi:hypothetical protein